MSRFYDITLTDPNTGKVKRQWTNKVNGLPDPNALLIEMDVLVGPEHTPLGGNFVKIWGVSLQDIGQASDFNLLTISVSGGMQKGLPLANPKQAALLFTGTVNQAFGNWQGTGQSIDLLSTPLPSTQDPVTGASTPLNLAFHWRLGTALSDAIRATLTAALPGYKVNIAISSSVVYSEDAAGYYWTVEEFSGWLHNLSRSIVKGTYQGISIVVSNKTISVFDGTVPVPAKQIQFTDLIGQVTWIGPFTVSFKTVMRGDINVGDQIKLPPGQITTTPQALSQFRQGPIFQGVFQIATVRHVGNSRQPNADSWVTVFEAFVAEPS